MAKTVEQKRREALERLRNSTYERSKAFRKGVDRATWETQKGIRINQLKNKEQ